MVKFYKIQALIFGCLFFHSSFAKIIKHDVYQTSKEKHSYKQVCFERFKRDFPLIGKKSISKLDCMGKVVDAITYCEQKHVDKQNLVRAYLDDKSKSVVCQSAQKVILKYSCEGKKDHYCQDKSIGCFKLKETFARRLKLSHESLLSDLAGKKVLNCYFISKETNDLHNIL